MNERAGFAGPFLFLDACEEELDHALGGKAQQAEAQRQEEHEGARRPALDSRASWTMMNTL